MSDLPNDGNPTGEGSPASQQENSEQKGQPLEALIAKAIEPLQNQIKALQSDKDKAAFRAESLSKTNAADIERLGRLLNKSPEEIQAAQRQAVLDDLVSERMQPQTQPVQSPVGTAASTGAADVLADIDRELVLPTNDPRVTQLKIDHGANPVKYAIAAAKLKESLTQSPPTPAEQPLPQGNVQAQRQPTANALTQEYEKQRDEIMARGLPHAQRLTMLTDLKAVYRGKGLTLR